MAPYIQGTMAPLKGTPICDPSVGSFQLSLAPFLPLYLTHTIQTHTRTHHVHVSPPLRVAYHYTRTRTRTRTLTTPRAQHHTPHCHHYITLRHLLASTYYITRRCMPARTYACARVCCLRPSSLHQLLFVRFSSLHLSLTLRLQILKRVSMTLHPGFQWQNCQIFSLM